MSDQPNTGGPAFPVSFSGADGETVAISGMTLRDWFAGQSLAGLRSNTHAWAEMTSAEMIDRAWKDADAMLAARDGEG